MSARKDNKRITISSEKNSTSIPLKPPSSMPQRWLAACAHELRIPIAQIDAAMMILAADSEDNHLTSDERKKFIYDVVSANESLNLLVEDCIAFAKGTQADFAVTLATVNLYDLLKQLHHSFLGQMNDGISLLFEYSNTTPTHVIGDSQRITQCVANLIRNAVKFTEKGSITLRVSALGENFVSIAITDTGIGIADDQIHVIWNAFTKVHDYEQDAIMGRHKGLGLGLAIVSQFVGQMNGEVNVESEPGVGSTFSFTLPVTS